ncbi:MAG: hypothetical protein LAQ69_44765 [Acidobacteriia bacterium]|nr:hypothetical protein [Terriglobia bacterium]
MEPTRIQEAKAHADRGLPIRDAVLGGSGALAEPTTAKDPTKVVTAFLSHSEEWKSLYLSLEALRAFLADKRHHEYDTSRRIAELATNHPVDSNHGSQTVLERSLKDMEAIIGERMGAAEPEHFAHRAYRSCDIMSYLSKSLETLLVADHYFEFAEHGPAL